jgi:hypothetical protein
VAVLAVARTAELEPQFGFFAAALERAAAWPELALVFGGRVQRLELPERAVLAVQLRQAEQYAVERQVNRQGLPSDTAAAEEPSYQHRSRGGVLPYHLRDDTRRGQLQQGADGVGD